MLSKMPDVVITKVGTAVEKLAVSTVHASTVLKEVQAHGALNDVGVLGVLSSMCAGAGEALASSG